MQQQTAPHRLSKACCLLTPGYFCSVGHALLCLAYLPRLHVQASWLPHQRLPFGPCCSPNTMCQMPSPLLHMLPCCTVADTNTLNPCSLKLFSLIVKL